MIETNNYLNYIEINEGSLDLVIKFPSGSKVSMVKGTTKRVLQPNNCQCTRCLWVITHSTLNSYDYNK